MQLIHVPGIVTENHTIHSKNLGRDVIIDCYLPAGPTAPHLLDLLLVNDGQNLTEMSFPGILEDLYASQSITPLFCVGIHAGEDRKMEYGIASQTDYLGRGAKAASYTAFILQELIPFIRTTYSIQDFHRRGFAGFSLGGLTALDIAWNHADFFNRAGIFSGSLWWRSLDQEDPRYDDGRHKIMHQSIRTGLYKPGLQFFFQCGNRDETRDRNNNGIIDSIDDTMDLVKELLVKGYDASQDIYYLEIPEGRHDVATWGEAMPQFLRWAFGPVN